MDIAIAIKMGIQMDTQMATLMEIQAMETGNLLEITKSGIFGSDRSPRRGDLVRVCVRDIIQITVKISSSSILKSPGEF